MQESARDAARMHDPLQLTVNGAPFTVRVREHTALMYVLRNELGMKGVRAGCTIGECGSCTVLVDGVPRRSCQTPVNEAIGRSVVTPEGLGTRDTPHPVQCAFLDEQAAQLLKLVETLSQTCEDLRSERDGWHKAALNYQHLFRQSLGLHVETYGSGGDEHE